MSETVRSTAHTPPAGSGGGADQPPRTNRSGGGSGGFQLRNLFASSHFKRLIACEFGGLVLALMVGNQEGTLNDFGVSFREAVARPRVIVFLLIGFIIFLLITFWPLVRPYVRRPGVTGVISGLVVIVAALTVMNWYDPLASAGSGKFSDVRSAVDKTPSIGSVTAWFFDWGAWTLTGAGLVACGVVIVTRIKLFGYLAGALGVLGAVLAYTSHSDVVDVGGGIDHSLGHYTAMIGYLILGGAGIVAAVSTKEVAEPRAFIIRTLTYRHGLYVILTGVLLGLLALINDCWFGPLTLNADFSQTGKDFQGTAISSLGSAYLSWLGWTTFAVGTVLAVATTLLPRRIVGLASAVVGVAGIVLTFFTLQTMTTVGASVAPQHGGEWKNLGVGGFVMCIVYSVYVAGAIQAGAFSRRKQVAAKPVAPERTLPVSSMVGSAARSRNTKAIIVLGLAIAIFYPPMLPIVWQNVLVVQIGVFVLLALGLNVVVGWAGLLDLGYIAFYAVGAYTTAYFTGALPVKPPSWLHLKPLECIPFAIVACLIAGVILGAPTLRLRGDYLAIVTLGFGEMVQLWAINAKGITGGPQGPTIPHPSIDFLGISITFGEDNLPYWYLLLIILIVVIVLFYRLEGSRIGRAWAAIREDEVAAQASGVNTVRIKLLAFAIGASTSALAGVFFASEVGYFDPSLFTLQASILIVAYVVFGGMGSLPGAMAGAAVLTWLPQFLKDQVPQDDRQMWVGALVLAMMIFRPAGLLPARRRKAELTGLDAPPSPEVSAVPASEGL
jgi:ABC-type branched-subunit amino acid transport system permease subunit